jgi:hypothetical protein
VLVDEVVPGPEALWMQILLLKIAPMEGIMILLFHPHSQLNSFGYEYSLVEVFLVVHASFIMRDGVLYMIYNDIMPHVHLKLSHSTAV